VWGGHLQIESFDEAGRGFFDRSGLDGSFDAPASDSLLVTSLNSTGNKIDSFLDRSVAYTARVQGNGDLEGTVSISLRNRAPRDGLPTYVIGSATTPPLPLGTNRTTLLIYTSVPARVARVDGRPVQISSQLTGGRWLSQIPVELPAGQEATVEVDVAGPLGRPASGYQLEIEPGGGIVGDPYAVDVTVDGRQPLSFRGDPRSPTVVG
jgi:hypothetical protein